MADRTCPPEPIPAHSYIRQEMEARGWTAADVAARCDLTPEDVQRVIELGTYRNPFTVEMPQFAGAFGVAVELLENLIAAEMEGHMQRAAWLRDVKEAGCG